MVGSGGLKFHMESSAAVLEPACQGIAQVSAGLSEGQAQVTQGGSVKEVVCDTGQNVVISDGVMAPFSLLQRVELRVLREQALPEFWRPLQGVTIQIR